MKKNRIYIGIDVSKATLDVFIHRFNLHFIVENNAPGFAILLETIILKTGCKKRFLYFCFENTGKYSRGLSIFLESKRIPFAMEPALQIKKSLGITRGKNDKIDARRIAHYAYEKRERLTPTVLPGPKIDKIRSLLSLREKLLKHRTAYKNGISDLQDCYEAGEFDLIKKVQMRQINNLDGEIKTIEEKIAAIIELDENLSRNYQLILSVKGIGKIVGQYMVAYTANFTSFSNARSFACYAGIAPFAYSSGTVKSPGRVHPFANKKIKALLYLAAMSAIQPSGEYKQYYERRINELGKSKMSTLNIIRNKIVYRAFAVVKRQTPYLDDFKYAE